MTYKTKEELKQHIIRNHQLFSGCSAQDATGWIIDELEEILRKNPAITGITYEATQYAEGYGKLETLITIGKDENGWAYTERTKEGAPWKGLI